MSKYKEIYCYETGEKFNSAKDIYKLLGGYLDCRVINDPNKTFAGYHWCSDLSIFEGIKLKGGNGSNQTKKLKIYCYETKEEFNSIHEASKYVGLKSPSSIHEFLNNPNRTAAGYHWCTDLSIFDNTLLSSPKLTTRDVYCYETKEKFNSIADAFKHVGLKHSASIFAALNDPNNTAANYHWCTDLSIFDNVELIQPKVSKRVVYCYETKEKFDSITSASKLSNSSNISTRLNNPNKTAGGYHWCSDLSIFDGVDLYYDTHNIKKVVYCYETKQKFESLQDAVLFSELVSGRSFSVVINNPNKTANGYHWCTDLSVFDNLELFYPEEKVSSYEREIVEFLKESSVTNIITSDRKVLGNNQELDIYLPDYKLAIEFNGNYWHSTEFKEINYHQEKTLLARSKGIDLIQIFEFQYDENKDIYLNYILDRINGIDRPDLELDDRGNHNLQFCNKKYFLEKLITMKPETLDCEKNKIYDCGRLKLSFHY